MRSLAPLCALVAGPASCQVVDVTCRFPEPYGQISFAIDSRQFAPARDSGEPPRRLLTDVDTGDGRFEAEPIYVPRRLYGFWSEDRDQMLVTGPEGEAQLSVGDQTFVGHCAVQP